MQQRIESLILRNLIHNEEFSRKVLPFLKDEYFMEHTDKLLYNEVSKFIEKYNNLPTKEALVIELGDTNLKDDEFEGVTELINQLEVEKNEEPDIQWLLETCLLYTSPSPRDRQKSRMPSSA